MLPVRRDPRGINLCCKSEKSIKTRLEKSKSNRLETGSVMMGLKQAETFPIG